jgi:YhcH/YjgK/YiaL family protein
MICDHLSNAPVYAPLGEGIRQGLAFLARPDLSILGEGRYDIDGDRVFALISDYTTREAADAFWEAHQQHLDIHALQSGVERVACGHRGDFTVEPYDASKDLTVAHGEAGQVVRLRPGWFVILFPHDVHMPGLTDVTAGPVRKIVVKVRLTPDDGDVVS